MRREECEHLKARPDSGKHPRRRHDKEGRMNRLICGICNRYMDYEKRR